MASLPKSTTVTYEEWLRMPEDGRLRRSTILAEGILKPARFPGAEIDISRIWPD